MEFTVDINVLVELLKVKKSNVLRYLKKHFKKDIHYKQDKPSQIEVRRGGMNVNHYFVTETCYELIKNSYDMRNNYNTEINRNINSVNVIMCLENSTIGFIMNSLLGIVDMKRQYVIDKYRVDLYFLDIKLIVECDENNHDDRNPDDEKIREEFLISLGNKIIRFNPNDISFDLSNVLREINSFIFGSRKN
jgi:very-short-patch-repair endonuclease